MDLLRAMRLLRIAIIGRKIRSFEPLPREASLEDLVP